MSDAAREIMVLTKTDGEPNFCSSASHLTTYKNPLSHEPRGPGGSCLATTLTGFHEALGLLDRVD